ncbi:NAD(P)/FAD-dependent oxidoreductase [Streptomyces sp. NPDC052071]|uniref:phytoene desaturase family protein n=1 Tax=Streptomyces TaxID=1883 RepID=UPI0006908905|nr:MULTISPECIES: NAD(P)/FAD-dependent oxidoreductase [Streptomyces]MDX2619763.1 NAD(P)/FAD-dependent oxidoreductase [Streptomyces sp. WI03-5b]MDX3185824.1 NAD(P)/FAD-dependent oxidoreductase [Streptomyces sp. ME02-7008A-1]MDX3306220.1 NAD(P)/FAD-dependent oxidoreductase [Streptomyces sp. ME02-7008A]MEE1776928.1 NAD(P)/FAD-dependent oxidoreductase [Streptomyces sp. JV181]MYT60667.1 NAD(P)-binding protein [Streptomyces sp. SID7834]
MARIAVIGAGTGAMAAAARLSVAGHRVTVYERAETYGGSLGRFARDGFVFDTGPGLLHLPAVYRDLFVKTGKESLEQCVTLTQVDPASRHLFADGTAVSLPNASRAGVTGALDRALGEGAGARWGDFLDRAGEAWNRSRRPLLEEPLPEDRRALACDPYPAVRHRRLLRPARQAGTVAEVGAWELTDPRLASLLDGYALSYGLDPRRAPAAAALLPYMEETFGSWYVAGGVRALADAVYARCLARKVEFVFGAEVVRVAEKDGRAAGIELADGASVEADHVVLGAQPAPGLLPVRDGGRPAGAPSVPGRFQVLLSLRGAREAGAVHRTVVHTADPGAEQDAVFGGRTAELPTVTVLRPDDPATRPDDAHEAVTLTVTVAPHGPVDWTDAALRERFAETVIARAAEAVPGLRERTLHAEVRTPAETEAETGAEGGSVPAPALAGAEGSYLHAANRSPLPGLYRAGGWSHPGGGLAHAGMSGALVAGLVVEGDGFRGSQ